MIYRKKEKSIISGVFAGLADHFSSNADAMRLLFVLLIIFTPFTLIGGIIFYLMAVVLMPEEQ